VIWVLSMLGVGLMAFGVSGYVRSLRAELPSGHRWNIVLILTGVLLLAAVMCIELVVSL